MDNKKFNRRNFLGAATALGITLPLNSFSATDIQVENPFDEPKRPNINLNDVSEAGVIVSTHPKRGHFRTADFKSDVEAVQYAYDQMMTNRDLPKTLILDSSFRPFEFDGYLDIWQSKCRITATGGTTIVPKPGYKGPVIQSTIRDETEVGEDKLISNVIMDNIWIDGKDECMGIRLRHLQMSTIHDIHVRSTDGPGLWISDCVIENLFSNLIISDNCGSEEYPALLIEPEWIEISRKTNGFGNPTINSTQFSGIMIHFPTNDALRISAGPVPIRSDRRQRKMQFVGCFFHGHPRQTKPLVTLSDAFENTFIGTQMIMWKDEGVVIQIGEHGAQHPAGITMISHCIICSKPDSNVTGIKVVNVDTEKPSLILFGNAFGTSYKWLAHAVDWGNQKGKLASWGANSVSTSKEPHIGILPENADITPFKKDLPKT
ncbi:hypothetical protein [Aquiflexum sp.]|uniref:hypothetical protein n=1 Tax=Aquiflexum sp. TaxID=1872584 RepID=UPI0035943230